MILCSLFDQSELSLPVNLLQMKKPASSRWDEVMQTNRRSKEERHIERPFLGLITVLLMRKLALLCYLLLLIMIVADILKKVALLMMVSCLRIWVLILLIVGLGELRESFIVG